MTTPKSIKKTGRVEARLTSYVEGEITVTWAKPAPAKEK